MPRGRAPWAKAVEVRGVAARLYAREDRGGAMHREVRLGGGDKDRAVFSTSDRAHAVELAEANARRPVSTEARYLATLAHVDAVDPGGRFRCLLVLARHAGRHINSLWHLTAADVLRTSRQVEAALGATGQPVGHAAHWTHGALRFAAACDKRSYDAVALIHPDARAALDTYLQAHPRLGTAPLFPATGDDAQAVHKELAAYWLKRGEKLAKLLPLERGAWHAFRRLWVSERRHLPPQDVTAAGGWRSLAVMQTAYQHADAATTYGVVALGATTDANAMPREPRDVHAAGPGASSSLR